MRITLILVIILSLVFTSFPAFVSAQEITPSTTPSPTPIVYTMPYPGILPDHPFYFLKSFRDNLVGFFTSSPIKRAEYDVLQADKRIQEAVFLATKEKKEKLVLTALTKAENVFDHAIQQVKQAEQQGVATNDIGVRLAVANLKHQEIMKELLKGAKGEMKEKLVDHVKKIQEFEKKVKELDRK